MKIRSLPRNWRVDMTRRMFSRVFKISEAVANHSTADRLQSL